MMSSVPALGGLNPNMLNSPSHSNFQHSPAWSVGPWAKASTSLAAAVASVAVLEEVAASEVAPGVAALLVVVVVEQVVLVAKTPLPAVAVVVLRLWRRRSQVSLAKTIPSFRRSLTPRSFATGRLTVAITPTQRQSARLSTSAPTTGPAVAPSTPSSAPTALSSTSSTSSATGGSTWTAPWLSPSTP